MKNQHIWRRFGFAWQGIRESYRSEKSFRAHVLVFFMVVVLLLATKPAPLWWALLLLCSGLGMMVELINTAVEKLVDHLHPDKHEAIRIVKDTLAGAVLVICTASSIVFVAFLCVQFGGMK